MSDGKMSKSKGNVIYADDLVREFGVNAVRYFMLHEIPFSNDGVFSRDLLIDRINGDLVNVLGNLVNRTIAMAKKYFVSHLENRKVYENVDEELISMVNGIEEKVDIKMNTLEIGSAMDEIFEVLRRCNKYIDETTPWVLAKEESKKDRLETVLYHLVESIRVCAVFLSSYLPETSEKIMNQINSKNQELKFNDSEIYDLNEAKILFQRIEVK